MGSVRGAGSRAPRYRIERSAEGYRVVGPGLLVWEPTLGEAVERREELETPGWQHPLAPRPGREPTPVLESIVYGPVSSRRLGRSLGVNLVPPRRVVCTFECVYCSYARRPLAGPAGPWPTAAEVAEALQKAAPSASALDSITISGHGEPTLHPRFPEVVDRLRLEASRAWPGVPVRILTNGSEAGRPEVRAALDRLDERIVKLDAAPERVSRPGRRHPMGVLVATLAQLRDVTLQSCFIEGSVSNTAEDVVCEWADLVKELQPRAVQIYTIDRQSASADVRPVAVAHLEEIAALLRARTGIEGHVFA